MSPKWEVSGTALKLTRSHHERCRVEGPGLTLGIGPLEVKLLVKGHSCFRAAVIVAPLVRVVPRAINSFHDKAWTHC